MVTYVFNEYSVFDKSTRERLLEEANTPWTGGRIQLVFGRITKLKATCARHHVTLREDEKVDLVVGVIEQSGLLANDCSEWRKKDEADKTWDNLKAHFKRAAKALNTSSRPEAAALTMQPNRNWPT